jgi:hypothetical protein
VVGVDGEHLLGVAVLEAAPAQLGIRAPLGIRDRRKQDALPRRAEALRLTLLAQFGLVEALHEQQVGDLLDHLDRVRDPARPEGIPDSIDPAAQFPGDHAITPQVNGHHSRASQHRNQRVDGSGQTIFSLSAACRRAAAISKSDEAADSRMHHPDLDPAAPMTLASACQVHFAGAIKPSTLLAEARRGTLKLERIGRRYFITHRDLMEMREKCRVDLSEKDPGSGSSPSAPIETEASRRRGGSFATDRSSAAQGSLQATLQALSKHSSATSPKSINPAKGPASLQEH